jgi:hypothetical protein|tara:strand:- start:229 stop:645 length:417 start_codon:yes stop_codon:yes gene_type:complete
MKHPTHSELKYYSTHSTLESAEGFIKQIKDFVSYKVINYKIRKTKRFGQGRNDYDLYVQFGDIKFDQIRFEVPDWMGTREDLKKEIKKYKLKLIKLIEYNINGNLQPILEGEKEQSRLFLLNNGFVDGFGETINVEGV